MTRGEALDRLREPNAGRERRAATDPPAPEAR